MRLRFKLGENVEYHQVDRTDVVIGHGEDCTIVLPQEAVATHHARVLVRRRRLVLVDLDTRAGTSYLGASIKAPVAIDPGTPFLLGDVEVCAWIDQPDEPRLAGRRVDGLRVIREIDSEDEDVRRYRAERPGETDRESLILSCSMDAADAPAVDAWLGRAALAMSDRSRFLPELVTHGIFEGHGYLAEAVPRGVRLSSLMRAIDRAGVHVPIEAVIAIGAQVAEAAEAMHASWGPHGAIEPRSIILGTDGSVSLLRPSPSPAGFDDPLRRPFLSPERRFGAAASTASDAWSVAHLISALLDDAHRSDWGLSLTSLMQAPGSESMEQAPRLAHRAARLREAATERGLDPSSAHVARLVRLLQAEQKPIATLGAARV